MTTDAVKLAPSILAADFAHLGDQVEEAERAGEDRIHVDVMDGHFVPNLSMGPPIINSLRRVTHLPLEAHLMISNPDCRCRPQRLRFFRFTAVLGAGGFLWRAATGFNFLRVYNGWKQESGKSIQAGPILVVLHGSAHCELDLISQR